jgi:hypothetical protein
MVVGLLSCDNYRPLLFIREGLITAQLLVTVLRGGDAGPATLRSIIPMGCAFLASPCSFCKALVELLSS